MVVYCPTCGARSYELERGNSRCEQCGESDQPTSRGKSGEPPPGKPARSTHPGPETLGKREAGHFALARPRNLLDLANAVGLDEAIELHDHDRARRLIDAGANLRAVFEDDLTPLKKCALNGNLETAKYLIEKGADVNDTAMGKPAAVYLACAAGRVPMVRLLIEKGAELRDRSCCPTPLLDLAAESGNLDMRQLLEGAGLVEVREQSELGSENLVGRESGGSAVMDNSPDPDEKEGPQVEAVTKAIKQTALAQITWGIKTREEVIDDMLARHVFDDRADAAALVDDALACLADIERFQTLLEPVEGFEFELQREAAINRIGTFHQRVINILESDGDFEEKLARAQAMVQQRLHVSRELAEKIVQESARLRVAVSGHKAVHPDPAPVSPGPVERFLGGLRQVYDWLFWGWGVPSLVRTAINHAFEILRDCESLVPFVMLEGHPTISIAMMDGDSNEESFTNAGSFLDQEQGKFSKYVFVAIKHQDFGNLRFHIILAITGVAVSAHAAGFAQYYLPASGRHAPKKVGRPMEFDNCSVYTSLLFDVEPKNM
jgi:hypothetical protein